MRIMHNRWVSLCHRRAVRPETTVGDLHTTGHRPTMPSARRAPGSLAPAGRLPGYQRR